MSSEKEYDVPEEISDIDTEVIALEDLRDVYAKRPFGYKKALRASREAVKMNNMFWKKVRKLYPQLDNKGISYSREMRKIKVRD
jgi:hypothetical protein